MSKGGLQRDNSGRRSAGAAAFCFGGANVGDAYDELGELLFAGPDRALAVSMIQRIEKRTANSATTNTPRRIQVGDPRRKPKRRRSDRTTATMMSSRKRI